jgi:hypothetical protein
MLNAVMLSVVILNVATLSFILLSVIMLSVIMSSVVAPLPRPGNTKGGSITVPLTSCLTGLESAVCLLTIFVFICKTD